MRTEEDFLEWLGGSSIYIGYARYAQFGPHGFVCVSRYEEDEMLQNATSDLDAGDQDAIDAAELIRKSGCWWACDSNPAVAMSELVEQIRRYYFDELNKQGQA